MHVLLCPDSFKDCISSVDLCREVATLMNRWIDDDLTLSQCPLADGGEGTMQVINEVNDCERVKCRSMDPLLRSIECQYAMFDKQAIFEMAAASGLELLKLHERLPLRTSSIGTGLVLRHMVENGLRHVNLGIGGSATNDCGAGMAQALGYRFLDKYGKAIEPCGGNLGRITTIDCDHTITGLHDMYVDVLCDVKNELLGTQGASYVYGPQKGASADDVLLLEENMMQFKELLIGTFGKDHTIVPGAGAAGGMGTGCMYFLNAKLVSGISKVAELIGLEERIEKSDLVVTGEGCFDTQSLNGKAISGVIALAARYNKPVLVIAGQIDDIPQSSLAVNNIKTLSLSMVAKSVEEAKRHVSALFAKLMMEHLKRD